MQRRAGAAVGCARQCAAGPVWLCGCVAVCGLSVRASALRCTHDTEDKLMLISRGSVAVFARSTEHAHTINTLYSNQHRQQ